MVPEAVAPLPLAISFRDIGKHVGEHRYQQGTQDQETAHRNDQAEDVIRLVVDREVARIKIEGEDVRPVQAPDPADETENKIQGQHDAGKPDQLPALALGEDPVYSTAYHFSQ